MELGTGQFAQSLPRLRALVLGCDFLGLDMEFTGLHSVFPKGKQPRNSGLVQFACAERLYELMINEILTPQETES